MLSATRFSSFRSNVLSTRLLCKTSTNLIKSGHKSAKPILSLEEFLFRQRILSVYRQLVRIIFKTHERDELLKFARDEFKVNSKVNDLNHRKYLLNIGTGRINDMMKVMGIRGPEF